MQRRLVLAAATAVALTLPIIGQASTTTGTMSVTATVPSACTVSATTLAFGSYYSSTALSGSANITVTCVSDEASVVIDLDAGAHGTLAGASTTRAMAAGASQLNYNLYQDSGHTTIWATGASYDVTAAANLTAVVPVYGLIPASQTATPGSYTDTVNVTVTY